jgi:two-component system NtrC family sensor kinase
MDAMTLRRTMAYEITATIVGLLLISGASLWGLNALHQDFDSSIAGYQELRQVYEVSSHVATARTLLTLARADDAKAHAQIQAAVDKYDLYSPPTAERPATTGRKAHLRLAVRNALADALRIQDTAARVDSLNRVLAQVANLVNEIRRQIERAQQAADANRRTATILMSVLSAVVVVGAVIVGVWQYRSVIRPLHRLGHAARTIAAGRFADRVPAEGHAEFAELADDFNRMAAELDGLYRQLEEKVAIKSKELARSERLASVGYLAAGVAHEINNPIGIIAGHAELMLGKLANEERSDGEVEGALRVICDEAFRCKDIVGKLLSLARPGDEGRRRISLAELAENVVGMVGGLGEHRAKRVTLRINKDHPLDVIASEAEMKQVLLNLVINALDAVAATGGEVWVEVNNADGFVELAVTDNGRGMTADVLDRVFEPFFTAKRGRGEPGMGLGLSISHAIVRSHRGTIRADSHGPGKGSRFVVRLPAAEGAGTQ